MKRAVIFIILISLTCLLIYYVDNISYKPIQQLNSANITIEQLKLDNDIKDGDIIFQTSLSGQSKAIQLATHSPYSHCGIIYKLNNEYLVFEAVQPVKQTPLNKWIARGFEGNFVIKRLVNASNVLNTDKLAKMKELSESFIGKNYDSYFNWSDEQIYCSELVWKIYKRAANIQISTPKTLITFDLSNPLVKGKLAERYGNNLPLNDTIVSPDDIFKSNLLETVINTY